MYKVNQYIYTSPINDRIRVPRNYKVLGIANQYSQGSSTGFTPTFNPYLSIAVSSCPENIELVFFSVKSGVGTIQSLDIVNYVGSYSITDDGVYSLWYSEENPGLDT